MTDAAMTPETDLGAPLLGRSVLVTRTREQAGSLVAPLEALGADVIAMPVLETIDPEDWGAVDAAIEEIGTYDWIVFTSTNGVDRFFHRFRQRHGNYDDLASTCMAAVGSATAHRMRSAGYPPAIVPEDFRAEGLVEAFLELDLSKCRRVLIPRAEEAREVFPDALRAMGCAVDVVVVYRTAPAPANPDVIARLVAGDIDVVSFTSGAIAAAFRDAVVALGLTLDEAMASTLVASIGPITSEALHSIGYEVAIEAAESTMGSLVDAIVHHYTGEPVAEATVAEEPV